MNQGDRSSQSRKDESLLMVAARMHARVSRGRRCSSRGQGMQSGELKLSSQLASWRFAVHDLHMFGGHQLNAVCYWSKPWLI